ncbi:glutathione S-transferase family protein [Pararhodobacter sp.]|jgi:glutathione S-transferase|uniref:glutathione S-transferase family protein n=1 Tax=Pararhodobacter sp. TaxID=2127056 RepID=UPI002FDC89EB
MITLYGCLRSRASRPWWLLTEAGVEFTHEPVMQAYRLPDPAAADAPFNTASPAFLTINPQGQIPALEDDGLVLTESLAMTLYLARKYGGDLGPRDLAEEGEVLQWAFLAGTAVEAPALDILFTYVRGEADSEGGKGKIAASVTALARPLARIEAHLKGRDWLVGGRFTVADLALAECLRYAQPHPPALAPFEAVSDWLARCQARPAFQAMVQARSAEPA